MNFNQLSLLWVFFSFINIYCAEQSTKRKISDYFESRNVAEEMALPDYGSYHLSKPAKKKQKTITDFFEKKAQNDESDPSLGGLPIQIKPRLAIALFTGKEINHFLASAVMNMQPHSQALMSLYNACIFSQKNQLNPLLQALYCQHKNNMGLDTQVISDQKKLNTNNEFLKFNNFLKDLGCQVNIFAPTKAQENGLTVCQKSGYGELHQKFYVFDKCVPNEMSLEKFALAVITSHNPTQSAYGSDQQNDALVVTAPSIVKQLKERFKFIKDRATVEFVKPVVDISHDYRQAGLDFRQTDFATLNLQKHHSQQVELLASPLNIFEQSIIKKIVDEIKHENRCIQIASREFSHPKVLEALIDALSRGVRVECVLDHKNSPNFKSCAPEYIITQTAISSLKYAIRKNNNNGFVKFFDQGKLLHHKFYTFHERQTVITGSANCTENSEKNCAEVDIKITDQENFSEYYQHFTKLAFMSQFIKEPKYKTVHQMLIESSKANS
jgi:hypothetical protein